jgi:CDP-diacylglycerol-serine O-phosphatidyltransferase
VLVIAFSCWIMISEVPMFALKFKNFTWHDNKVRYGFLALVVAIVIAGVTLEVYALALSFLIVLYALISLCVRDKQ